MFLTRQFSHGNTIAATGVVVPDGEPVSLALESASLRYRGQPYGPPKALHDTADTAGLPGYDVLYRKQHINRENPAEGKGWTTDPMSLATFFVLQLARRTSSWVLWRHGNCENTAGFSLPPPQNRLRVSTEAETIIHLRCRLSLRMSIPQHRWG